MPSRPPSPTSKANEILGLFDIFGIAGPPFPANFGREAPGSGLEFYAYAALLRNGHCENRGPRNTTKCILCDVVAFGNGRTRFRRASYRGPPPHPLPQGPKCLQKSQAADRVPPPPSLPTKRSLKVPSLECRINKLFSLLLIFKPVLISSMLGVPAAPAGQVDLPAGGARSAPRAPPVGRSIWPAGAAGIPKIDEIKFYFKISGKSNKWVIRHFAHSASGRSSGPTALRLGVPGKAPDGRLLMKINSFGQVPAQSPR